LRVGTRGSALALAQTRRVADAITAATGVAVELVPITTVGDRSPDPVPGLGIGVFVSALRDALAAKEIEVAVHSYKDLPTAPADGLQVAAVPPRADPRDALVARDGLTLAQLPAGSRIGTGAPRRVAQLRALGRSLELVPVRGNVDTRLGRVAAGVLDAVVLARAGLARLGREREITETLDPGLVLPAPAQGALAVECRADDTEVVGWLATIDDPASRLAVSAERALLATLEAGCTAPVAGLAGFGDRRLHLRGAVISPDGSRAIRLDRSREVPPGLLGGTGVVPPDAVAAAEQLGRDLAADLFAAGAHTILAAGTRGVPARPSGERHVWERR
jgi:hydroxymethylbilane synthase